VQTGYKHLFGWYTPNILRRNKTKDPEGVSEKSMARNETEVTEKSNGTIQAVDVPVGVAARAVDRVRPYIEPLTDSKTREPQLAKYRQQLTTELKQAELRGTQLRNKAVTEFKPRVEQELTNARQRVEVELRKIKERVEALV
jgi:hypothetical protein